MAKFNLLTTLVMNTAGYEKGIDRAKKSTQGLQSTVQTVGKSITGALSFAGIGLSFAGVVKVLKDGLVSTGEGADILEKATLKVNAAVQSLGRSILAGNFTTLAQDMRKAMLAAGNFADEMDAINSQTLDLSVRKSDLDAQIKGLKALQAEGKLTKEQAIELSNLNKELYNTEIKLIQAKADATIKMGAETRGINKELFKDMKSGVVERSKLNDEELQNVRNFTNKYKEFEDKIRKKYTKRGPDTAMGPGVYTTDMIAVNKELETFISNATDVERVQLFEDLFSSEPQWQLLIGYFNELNLGMGEFNRNQGKIISKGNAVKEAMMTPEEMANSKTNNFILNKGYDNLKVGSFAGAPAASDQLAGINMTREQIEAQAEKNRQTEEAIELQEKLNEAEERRQQIWESFSKTLSEGADSYKDYVKVVKAAVKQMIGAMIAEGVTAMILAGLKAAKFSGPAALIVAPALAALGAGLARTAFNSLIPGFANGGISAGGMAVVGERGPELVNLPSGARIFSNTQSMGMMGGDVTFRIEGTTLVGVLNNYNRKTNAYR